jgi:N6-L-threonylcarbamoyladenine synthase
MNTQNKKPLTVLGIESSCDETAAAVVRRGADGCGDILSDVVLSQDAAHAPYGGVVPEIAARAHVTHMDHIVARAIDEAGIGWRDLDAVAATSGPGLIGGVIVGLMTAKSIALVHRLPLVAVNHLEGHALTARLTGGLRFPYLLLLVSGGHTQLQIVEGVGQYTRLGTTIDDALGEAFDKTAKLLGLGFPGGPAVERAAATGDAGRFELPRPLLGRDDCNFSFSGLKTAVRNTAARLQPLTDRDIADLCAAFQMATSDCLRDRTARAMAVFKRRFPAAEPAGLVVAGGVASNAHIRSALEHLAREQGFAPHFPPPRLCTDNAAMIAWAGAERLAIGDTDPLDAMPRARWPLDPDAEPAPGAGVKA